LYDPSTGILHFVDIDQKRLYHYDTASSTLIFDEFDEPVTALALRQNGQGVSAFPYAALGIDDPGCSSHASLALDLPLLNRALTLRRNSRTSLNHCQRGSPGPPGSTMVLATAKADSWRQPWNRSMREMILAVLYINMIPAMAHARSLMTKT